MKKILIVVGVLVLVIVIVVILVQKNKAGDLKGFVDTNSLPIEAPSSNQQELTNLENSTTQNKVSFAINGGNFYFKPNIITAKQGDVISVTFKNDDGFHDFVIDEFNVKTQTLKSGGEETITFTVDKKGSFEFYCSVGSHRQMGMKGTLIVE
ncbi:MAG: cupredoxin domain-containing protein [Candidatus Paceibacterota bacterium]|jgi:plastocyanin